MPYRLIHDGAGTVIGFFEAGERTRTYTKFTLIEKPTEAECVAELEKLGAKEMYVDSVKRRIITEAPTLTKDTEAVKFPPEKWTILEDGSVNVAYEIKPVAIVKEPVELTKA